MQTKEKLEVYKCSVCGNITTVLHVGGGEMVCCNKPMDKLEEKTQDEGQEKHVPVVERTANGIKVKVGNIAHPMKDAHYIEWIELTADGTMQWRFLTPNDLSEAEFCVLAEKITVRVYCNLHGLWRSN